MNKGEKGVEGSTIIDNSAPGGGIVFRLGAVVTIEGAQLFRVNNGLFGGGVEVHTQKPQ